MEKPGFRERESAMHFWRIDGWSVYRRLVRVG